MPAGSPRTRGRRDRRAIVQRRGPIDLLLRFGKILTCRDTFAFLFAFLILVGLPMVALGIFAGVATIWILFVVQHVLAWGASRESERSA